MLDSDGSGRDALLDLAIDALGVIALGLILYNCMGARAGAGKEGGGAEDSRAVFQP